MAKKNFLNIIEEIGEIKGYNTAIFTTYSFDAIFFENVLMRQIKQNNPTMKIIVLVDANHYPDAMEQTDSTGVDYLLLPVAHPLFHPKIFLFMSEEAGLVYIGSHNLTPSGITHNLELTYRTQERSLINDCVEFFKLLFSRIYDPENPVTATLSKFEENPKREHTVNRDIRLIHNLNQPILRTALDYLIQETPVVDDVVVFSPFFSNEVALLKQISDKTKASQIHVCIQKKNHNLDIEHLSELPFVRLKEVVSKGDRLIHSKFLSFNGNGKFVMVGSPNFTDPALNQTMKDGNIEVALLIRLENEASIFDELIVKDITEDEARNSARQITQMQTSKAHYETTILMASVGQFGQLDVRIDANVDERQLTLIVESSTQRVSLPTVVEPNVRHKDFPIRVTGPTTIWFEQNGQRVSNRIRIYNPSGMVSRFVGYTTDAKTVSRLIADVKDLEGILEIIAALLQDEEYQTATKQPPQIPEPSPGLIHGAHTTQSVFDILMELMRIPRSTVETYPAEGIKESGEKPNDKTSDQKGSLSAPLPDAYSYFPALLDKWAASFSIRKLAIDPSLINYSVYLLVSLKLVNIFCRDSHSTDRMVFLNRIMNNISSMISKHGIVQKQEDLLLFTSMILHLKNEIISSSRSIQDYGIDLAVLEGLSELENLVFSLEDPLRAQGFKKQVLAKLVELKLATGNDTISDKLMAALVAATIMKKTEESRLMISESLIGDISKMAKDSEALFICQIMRFLYLRDAENRGKIHFELLSKTKDKQIRGFRIRLYEDILTTI